MAEGPEREADSSPDIEIDLAQEEVRDRCMRFLGEVGYPTEPFGVYLFPASSPDSELARHVEHVVFEETYGNTREVLDEEYGPYEDATVFVCVMDQQRHLPVGAMRLITTSPAGFKTLHDLEKVWGIDPDVVNRTHNLGLNTDSMMDVTTLSVIPEYRSAATDGLITLALLGGMSGLFRLHSTEWAVCIMDLLVYRLVQELICEPYTPFPGAEPKRYLDSPASLPLHCNLVNYWRKLADADPYLNEVSHARGLDPAVRLPTYPAEVLPAGVTTTAVP